MINAEYIQKVFPAIKEIKNDSLREGVIRVWLLACEKGKWDTIDDIPFTLLTPTKISLIEHVCKVTTLAIAVAKERLKNDPQELDFDILVAGALTHDVGKLVEYERKDGKVVKTEIGNKARHPNIGYGLAIEAKLPHEVAHIILAHSHEGDTLERSPEAIVINHCDFIDFELVKSKNKKA